MRSPDNDLTIFPNIANKRLLRGLGQAVNDFDFHSRGARFEPPSSETLRCSSFVGSISLKQRPTTSSPIHRSLLILSMGVKPGLGYLSASLNKQRARHSHTYVDGDSSLRACYATPIGKYLTTFRKHLVSY